MDRYVGQNPDKNNKTNWDELEVPTKGDFPHEKDMHETKVPKRTGKKVSGVHDIKMLLFNPPSFVVNFPFKIGTQKYICMQTKQALKV